MSIIRGDAHNKINNYIEWLHFSLPGRHFLCVSISFRQGGGGECDDNNLASFQDRDYPMRCQEIPTNQVAGNPSQSDVGLIYIKAIVVTLGRFFSVVSCCEHVF